MTYDLIHFLFKYMSTKAESMRFKGMYFNKYTFLTQ